MFDKLVEVFLFVILSFFSGIVLIIYVQIELLQAERALAAEFISLLAFVFDMLGRHNELCFGVYIVIL